MIEFDNVTKVYGEDEEDSVLAVDDVSLSINEGEFVTIVGPSGCGKTTLLHMAASLLEPTEGQVTLHGQSVASPDFDTSEVGLVFQSPVLLDWRTVEKNILLPIEIMVNNGMLDGSVEDYRSDVHDLIELVGLEGFADAYPYELSGGMKQRVSICRSLVYDPPILLMDEPFGALDELTRKKMNEELLNIWEQTGKTVLFVTHALDESVFLSDRVIVLTPRPGRIVDIFDIPLDRPRTDEMRSDDEFLSLVGELHENLEQGGRNE